MDKSVEKKFDLQKRIFVFVISVISFTKKLPKDAINSVLINQIIRSATSIGANYEEADGSRSKKEFVAIMGVVKKEAKETKYWLKVIRASNAKTFTPEIDMLGQENEQLIKIFAKIILNTKL